MTNLPLADLPRYHADRKSASARALVHPEGSLTWAELEAASNRRAHLYRCGGVKPGDFVTLALPNGNAFCEALFAIWKLGAIPNPIPPGMPSLEARPILELVRPSLIVGALPGVADGVPTVPGDSDLQGFPPDSPPSAPPANHWKAMISGGSTGRPKVIVTKVPAYYDPTVAFMDQPIGCVVLNALPLYHNAGFLSVSKALFVGNTVVGMRRFDAEEMLRLIEHHRVEWTMLVPTMMNRILALPEAVRAGYDLSSLRAVWHGMSFMPATLKRAWLDWLGPEKIWEIYGGTEGQGWTVISGSEWLQHPGSVGRVQKSGGIKVFRDDGSEAAAGEAGEIFFLPSGGPGSTYHYLGAEPNRRADGWESLGDIGWLDQDGYLFLADRRTDLIVRGGANIYPAEVEVALDAHEDVISSLVIGLPHTDLGRVVHAIVEPRSGRLPTADELDAYLSSRLANYKRPASYELTTQPLRDDAGKARRAAVREQRERWLAQGHPFRLVPSRLDRE